MKSGGVAGLGVSSAEERRVSCAQSAFDNKALTTRQLEGNSSEGAQRRAHAQGLALQEKSRDVIGDVDKCSKGKDARHCR